MFAFVQTTPAAACDRIAVVYFQLEKVDNAHISIRDGDLGATPHDIKKQNFPRRQHFRPGPQQCPQIFNSDTLHFPVLLSNPGRGDHGPRSQIPKVHLDVLEGALLSAQLRDIRADVRPVLLQVWQVRHQPLPDM